MVIGIICNGIALAQKAKMLIWIFEKRALINL